MKLPYGVRLERAIESAVRRSNRRFSERLKTDNREPWLEAVHLRNRLLIRQRNHNPMVDLVGEFIEHE